MTCLSVSNQTPFMTPRVNRVQLVEPHLEPSHQKRRVREREATARVLRQRRDHRAVNGDARGLVVRVEGVSPSGVEVRVRDEVDARMSG